MCHSLVAPPYPLITLQGSFVEKQCTVLFGAKFKTLELCVVVWYFQNSVVTEILSGCLDEPRSVFRGESIYVVYLEL